MVWLKASSLLKKIYNVNISTNLITQSEEFRFSWKLIRWQTCCAQYEPSVIPVALIKNSDHINEMPLLQIGPHSAHVRSVWTCIRLITWCSLHVVTCNKPVSSQSDLEESTCEVGDAAVQFWDRHECVRWGYRRGWGLAVATVYIGKSVQWHIDSEDSNRIH